MANTGKDYDVVSEVLSLRFKYVLMDWFVKTDIHLESPFCDQAVVGLWVLSLILIVSSSQCNNIHATPCSSCYLRKV
ncbi:hypothetical protein P3L10_016179 [Capsicum annuum]